MCVLQFTTSFEAGCKPARQAKLNASRKEYKNNCPSSLRSLDPHSQAATRPVAVRLRPACCARSGGAFESRKEPQERPWVVEDDPRYRRVDFSEVHAYQARRAFVQNIALGPARMHVAEAALHIAAEDDALVTHSAVELPVQSYLDRIARMARELGRLHLAKLPQGRRIPEQVLQVVENYLYKEQGFGLPSSGRSNVPSHAVVDHPGVFEDARHAYLNEVLIRKVGSSACLAIIYSDIMQRLLADGTIDFCVRVEVKSFDTLPSAEALPGLTRELALQPDGSVANTCTPEVLAEVLRHLKRAYWPFSWQSDGHDPGGGAQGSGFVGAARVALEGEASAALQAIAATARHRLERGIWTSPGAGDIRRALAAAERLAILCGSDCPWERRDAGVLLLHCGRFGQAQAELRAYAASPAARQAPPVERDLLRRLLDLLQEVLGADQPAVPVLSVESVLQQAPPEVSSEKRIPLTW